MPTPTKGPRFGGSPAHQRLIMANLAQSLFEHGRITTTEAKARRLRPYAESLISKAKVDSVANRRLVVKVIRDKSVLHTLFTEIGPSMATRPGGYTRIVKLGPRKGDNAPMAVIEIVESKEFAAQSAGSPKATKTADAPVETDVIPGVPADDAEAEPATSEDVDAAAANVDAVTSSTPADEAPVEDAAVEESDKGEDTK